MSSNDENSGGASSQKKNVIEDNEKGVSPTEIVYPKAVSVEENGLEFGAAEDAVEISSSKILSSNLSHRQHHFEIQQVDGSNQEDLPNKQSKHACREYRLEIEYVFYLSAYAVLGAVLRVYVARFFGQDCDDPSVNDFLTPLSRQICVTASGKTLQHGGALFLDLPANMIGSFVMGLITPMDPETGLRFPWFKMDHPLQDDDVLHAAYSVGFCGSLTTFASWNTQMVIMFVGTDTELGPQVVPAIFGYILGMMAAIGSFRFGRHVSSWLQSWRHPKKRDSSDEDENDNELEYGRHETISTTQENFDTQCCTTFPDVGLFKCLLAVFKPKRSALVLSVGLVVGFAIADFVLGINFYKNMFLTSLFAPLGALLRWKLSKWNTRNGSSGTYSWVPLGTFAANIAGAFFSILPVALTSRYSTQIADKLWLMAIAAAVKVGFAGSLSTVSSMVKEIVLLTEKYPGHAKPHMYGFVTCFVALTMSLVIYTPIVRTRSG